MSTGPTPAVFLDERFDAQRLDSRLQWFNPPEEWRLDGRRRGLVVRPRAGTDFWQRTHYGFRADSGHFLGAEVAGEFDVTTEVRFHFEHQYDQAGLLIRATPDCWIKASVEYELDGLPKLGAVVTNFGYSDWSFEDFSGVETGLRLRIQRRRGDVTVEYARSGTFDWKLIRVAHLHCEELCPLRCGLYACSPKGAGFQAEFSFLRIEHG
ncbi:MAG TPA: DUF1349 domain-containing protein [Terriglobia bacterium]|nr:DUF1349 domain-containing protein [Terriglobia bacterium]